MKPFLLLFFFIAIPAKFNLLFAQDVIEVSGQIVEADSVSPIPFAFVINKNTGRGIPSSAEGKFSIQIKITDTLLFSCTGKNQVKITLINRKKELKDNKLHLLVVMQEKAHQLKEVTIRNFDFSKEERKHFEDIINKPLNQTPVSSPISYLYDRYSKKARSREKLKELYTASLLEDMAKKRLPDDLLRKLTGNGNMNYNLFKKMCFLSDYYIITAGDYDLYQEITRCYKNYTGK